MSHYINIAVDNKTDILNENNVCSLPITTYL